MRWIWINLVSAIGGAVNSKEIKLNYGNNKDSFLCSLRNVTNICAYIQISPNSTQSSLDRAARFSKQKYREFTEFPGGPMG